MKANLYLKIKKAGLCGMYYYYSNQDKKPSFLSYVLVSLISAIIGGLLVVMFVPGLVKGNVSTTGTIEKRVIYEDKSPVVTVAEEVGPAVVGISNKVTFQAGDVPHNNVEQATGSGVIIDAKGYIVTNEHVIRNATDLTVTLANGKQFPAKIVGKDPRTDLAVIKIDPGSEKLTVARWGDSDKIKVGELAVAIGNPLSLDFARTVTAGIISAKNRILNMDGQQYELIQTDAAINPGNSGGALVNAAGEVIGINSIKISLSGVEGLGFAIPSNIAKPIVEELIKNGKVIRPWMGIEGQTIDEEFAQYKGLKQKSGVYVARVVKDGPSAKAGLKDNDIIIEFDGVKIEKFEDLRNAVLKHKVGDEVKVKVLRGDKEMTFKVKLGEMPAE